VWHRAEPKSTVEEEALSGYGEDPSSLGRDGSGSRERWGDER
jgi:hypothetical protein